MNGQKHYKDFADESHLSPRVRRHLTAMYAHLAITFLMAMFACYLQVSGMVTGGGLMPTLGGGLLLWTMSFIQNQNLRQLLLYGFGFLEGLGLAPAIGMLYYIHPSVLISALAMTAVIFLSFSATALYSPRRSYLYLGSIVSALMSILLVSSMFVIFLDFSILDNITIYGGLLAFSLMITFDTQMIVERVEMQHADPVLDAANLLINIVAVLRRLLVVMSQQQTDRSKRDRRRKSDQ